MLLFITQRSQADRALTNLPLYIADRGAASLWLFRSLIRLIVLAPLPGRCDEREKRKKAILRIAKSAVSPRYPTHENHEGATGVGSWQLTGR